MIGIARKPATVSYGPYDVARPLGEGGMGRVLLARHRTTGAEAVVKVMHDRLARDRSARQRFEREAEMMRRFRHPYAVALLDADLDASPPHLVMEYVQGVSLAELLRRGGRLTAERAGRLLGKLCVVLQAAHDQEVLHRDLSADNLMVVGDDAAHESIKVMDFGLSRGTGIFLQADKLQGTGDSVGCGTPDYLCPEQVRGETVDARGDLYSAGVILYQMLAGRLPFEGETDVAEILWAHLHKEPPTFAELGVHGLPAKVEAVVRSCLAKEPRNRYVSAHALADAYGIALGRPIVTPTDFIPAAPSGHAGPVFDRAYVLDEFEAWMPEAIALAKLRGFIQDVGGEVVESTAGLVRVRIAGPRDAAPARAGLLGWLGLAQPPAPPDEIIELHMSNQVRPNRSVVRITVVRHPPAAERPIARAFCDRVCRELRAYLAVCGRE